tara:strand:+ start:183 stop:1085 length:903 start_codon:yes stop_codon:yes gene_type:complete
MNSNLHESQAVDSFLRFLQQEKGLSRNTIGAYQSDVEDFLRWANSKKLKIKDFNNIQQAEKLLKDLTRRNFKGSSIARKVSSIKSFFSFLKQKSFIQDNPFHDLNIPKIPKTLPKTLSSNEVIKLLNAPNVNSFIGLRDRTMLELMYATGLRVSELVGLEDSNFDLQRGVLRVFGKGSKERMVPFGDDALYWLNQYINFRRENNLSMNSKYFFISQKLSQITREAFWQRINVYQKEIGLSFKISPHTLRHAFATHLINNGADLRSVQMLLGHSDLSSTQIYTHIAKQRLSEMMKKHHPRG